MRQTQCALMLCCICFITACASAPRQTTPSIFPIASLPAVSTATPAAFSNSSALGESLLLRIPKCDGIEIQDEPIIFSWPNIETRIKELGEALWGYYSCDRPQKEVVAFYKAHMTDPPYNNHEINWVERSEGFVGVYYNSANAWLYIWILPQPDFPEKTYIIVAISYVLVDC
jgi:hypothetical protein